MTERPVGPEFPHPVIVADLPAGESRVALVATAAQRDALARRFAVPGIDRLEARLVLTPESGHRDLRVRGQVTGRVRQACVVTLAPMETAIDAAFDVHCRSEPTTPGPGGDLDLDPTEDVEPLEDGTIDLGELVAEQFALEIPAYPRAPGASFDGFATGAGDGGPEDPPPNPFSVLAKLGEKG